MIKKSFIWDVARFCPLKCIYCYSESGPAEAKTDRDQLLRVGRAIVRERPNHVSVSGGEPALAKGIDEVGELFRENDIGASLFTSGWGLSESRLERLASVFESIHVSLDAVDPGLNDRLRGRRDAHKNAVATLESLSAVRARLSHVRFGVECTVLKSNLDQVEDYCTFVAKFAGLSFITVGPAIPSGRGTDIPEELLDAEELDLLQARVRAARALIPKVWLQLGSVEFLKDDHEHCVHLNPNGDVRAAHATRHVVGNLVDEPLEVLKQRAAEWRTGSLLARQLRTSDSYAAWATAVRALNNRSEG